MLTGPGKRYVLESTHAIGFDLPCVRCGYNLRGLEIGGRCPECGELIRPAAHLRILNLVSNAWLRRFALGMRLLRVGVVSVPIVAVAIVISAILDVRGRFRPAFELIVRFGWIVPAVCLIAGGHLATMRLRPQLAGRVVRSGWRLAARSAGGVTAIALGWIVAAQLTGVLRPVHLIGLVLALLAAAVGAVAMVSWVLKFAREWSTPLGADLEFVRASILVSSGLVLGGAAGLQWPVVVPFAMFGLTFGVPLGILTMFYAPVCIGRVERACRELLAARKSSAASATTDAVQDAP